MLTRVVTLAGLFVLVACQRVGPPFPDPAEPAFIGPLQTDISSTEAATKPPTSRTPEPTQTANPTATPIPHEQFVGVVLGGDFDERRPERNRFGVRADVFLLYVFDYWPTFPDRNQVTLISLPRDLWLQVPCSPLDSLLEGNDRVNASWAYGGFDCVRDTIAANFNLAVNAPMAFTDFDGFMWLIDRLGSLYLTPNQTYTDWCGNYHGTDGGGGYLWTWYEDQEYTMGPNEALCYVRGRSGHPSGDLDRNRRGLEVIQAVGDQYAAKLFDTWDPANVASELFAFMVEGQEHIQLSLDLADLISFAPAAGSAATAPRSVVRMTFDEVAFYRTPIYNASVLQPRVDLATWLDCMIYTELPFDPDAIRKTCTQITVLEPDA